MSKHLSDQASISIDMDKRSLVDIFNSYENLTRLTISIPEENTIDSTGMIKTSSGIVSAEDIGRSIEVAMNISKEGCTLLLTEVPCFVLDNLETDIPPVGFAGNILECHVIIGYIPNEFISQLLLFARACGHDVNKISIETIEKQGIG